MRMVDPLLFELDREAETTKKVISRVPDDKLGWRPHAKSKTAGELAVHLAAIPGLVASTLMLNGFDVAAPRTPMPVPATSAEIVKAFEAAVGAAKVTMSLLDDAKAMELWTLRAGDKEMFSAPRIGFLRTILLNHSVHHRGQLSVYLRLLDVPVPSIYGPTADEKGF